MPQITARDTATGKTVTFNWNGDGQPSDADMAEVFKAAASQGQAPEMDARGSLPGMHRDAPRTSADDPAVMELNQSLSGVARPQGLGDIASLLLPATALGTGLRSLRGYAVAAKDLLTGASEGSANREGLKKIPSVLRGMFQVATDPVSGGERAFQRAPLMRQMESLPSSGPMPTGRAGTPPISTFNPNDAPLYQRMDQLGGTPSAPNYSRVGMPRMAAPVPLTELEQQVAQAAKANRLSPEAQARLLETLKLRVNQ